RPGVRTGGGCYFAVGNLERITREKASFHWKRFPIRLGALCRERNFRSARFLQARYSERQPTAVCSDRDFGAGGDGDIGSVVATSLREIGDSVLRGWRKIQLRHCEPQ